MSAKTTIVCDFCKSEIHPAARRAKLAIPKPSRKQRQSDEYVLAFASMFGGVRESETRDFDVCLPCAVGLLALAGHERRELEEETAEARR